MQQVKTYTLITGATSGIGYELARVFAENGHNLIIVGRNEDTLNATAAELKDQFKVDVISMVRDLFVFENAFELYQEVKQKNLTVDTLVNDAGQGQHGKFIENDIYRELDIIELNICSLLVLTKFFLQDMVSRGSGKILNVSSVAGKVPGPYQAVYHGTKAFVQSFTIAVREEVKDTGVTLTALLPGATDTDFFNKADMNDATVVQEGDLADPAGVARDGYDALMAGKDMVISGFKNKAQMAMSHLMSDSANAAAMAKQNKPVDEK